MASAIDEDTKQTVAEGRATLGALITGARDDLRKAFLVFVFGFLGSFYALRIFVWDQLKADLNTNPNIDIVAVTPFDVILLQAKIGIFVGIIMAIPVVIYYGRDALRARGWWPAEDIPRWKLVVPGVISVLLFLGGIAYAYFLFFPLMLGFLASNAVNAGLQPSWSIVDWTQFIAFLSLSFGLAAQLPLGMSMLSYLRIVSYQAFRDRWRYAVLGIFVFGAVFSPPDPITQVMWALPLIGLYGLSLSLTRVAELLRRSSDEVSFPAVARAYWNTLAGVVVLAFGAVYLFLTRGGIAALNDALANLPPDYRLGPIPAPGAALGLDPTVAAALVAGIVALVAVSVTFARFAVLELDRAIDPTERMGDPTDIDLETLDASAVRVAPPEIFEEMSEDDAVTRASRLMEEDEPEKAEAILDRWDKIHSADGDGEGGDGEGGQATADEEEDSGVVTSTTAGVVDAFTEEETTEEDIGGYYYDIAFVLESLMSRTFRIVGVFMAVMAATFFYLYRGGIGDIREAFLSRMPESQVPDVQVVTLHPVEALIFEIKVSTLLGLVATLPVFLYYAWPALKERGLVGGDRRVLLVWGLTLFGGLIGGSILGFVVVAPAIISWLAADGIQASMVIYYRINNFGWLVIFTTVGIGLLAEVPVTMLLFERGGLLSFHTMFDHWRTVVMGIVVTAAFLTPSSLLTMLVLAIPVIVAYLLGLAVLWVVTLGGRRARVPESESEPAD
jgi:sec-independent protein translocase protein TatC